MYDIFIENDWQLQNPTTHLQMFFNYQIQGIRSIYENSRYNSTIPVTNKNYLSNLLQMQSWSIRKDLRSSVVINLKQLFDKHCLLLPRILMKTNLLFFQKVIFLSVDGHRISKILSIFSNANFMTLQLIYSLMNSSNTVIKSS